MSVKIKYSNSFKAKKERIKRLPQKMENTISGLIKKDLLEIKKMFHDGIKFNTFRLDRLAEITVANKKRKNFQRPKTPLYGAGDTEQDRSYSNMLIIIKQKNGWRLQASTKKHWSGKITLNELFKIHENGATIRRQKKDGGISLIKIPPRPVLHLAYRRFLITSKKKEKNNSMELKKAITEYINIGNEKRLKIISDYEKKNEINN